MFYASIYFFSSDMLCKMLCKSYVCDACIYIYTYIYTHVYMCGHRHGRICGGGHGVANSSIGQSTAWSAPSHYLNQCWNIVNWILGKTFQWNFNWNHNIFIQENVFEIVVCETAAILPQPQCVNSVGPSDAIWQQRSGSTLAQVMACCLTAPSHYLNSCWLIISKVQWHSSKGQFTRDASAINHWNYLEN